MVHVVGCNIYKNWMKTSRSILDFRPLLFKLFVSYLLTKFYDALIYGLFIAWLTLHLLQEKIFILIFASLLQIPVPNLITFAEALEVGYSKYKNPYHNLIHAADVTQTVHYIMIHTGIMVRNTMKFNLLLFADSLMFWINVYVCVFSKKLPWKLCREIPN